MAMASYLDGINIDSDLANLTKKDIMDASKPILFGKCDRWTCKHLLETVSLLNLMDQARIHTAAVNKRMLNSMGQLSQSKCQKMVGNDDTSDDEPQGPHDDSDFLWAPEESVIKQCISTFIDHTSNMAVAMVVCVVCARSMPSAETWMLAIGAIPSGNLLVPCKTHPAHKLTEGMLLQ